MAESRVWIERNRYHDSVSLMAATEGVRAVKGVLEAVLVMGTPLNMTLLERVDLLLPEAASASPMDLIIAVKAESQAAAEAALAVAKTRLQGVPAEAAYHALLPYPAPRSLRGALQQEPDLDFVFISLPGSYAGYEARRALMAGLDVMLYSDNVSIEMEVALKRLAIEQNRLCLGPDCGTAIIDGVGLGFANEVARGPIGVVAASGTGAQELSVLVDRLGSGISQLIGVGGRDLSEQVGGLMSLAALRRLQADPMTEVIVLITKPPAPAVRALIETEAAAGPKPVLLSFLDGSGSIDAVAAEAVAWVTGRPRAAVVAALQAEAAGQPPLVRRAIPAGVRPRAVGLFSGGSLCDQALAILTAKLGPIVSNIHPNSEWRIDGRSPDYDGHLLLDLGSDEFTIARPHPMIDFGLRRMYIREAAERRTTGAILLDCVCGWGANPDPAGAMAEAIHYATRVHGVPVLASVTATEADPQVYSKQVQTLREAGALVLPTAFQAATAVAEALAEGGGAR